MAAVASKPRSTTYLDSVSYLLKFSHALLPELAGKITAMVMRRYLKSGIKVSPTDGNLFTTVNYGMSTHGGFDLPGVPKAHRKYIAGALLAGFDIGWAVFQKRAD
jgi:hypothetical protein